ncbi:hypothetical protein MKX03_011370, partial [Papaver bracteatum]
MAPTMRKAGKYIKKWTTRRMFYSCTFSSACTSKKRCGRPCENSTIKKGGSDNHAGAVPREVMSFSSPFPSNL